MWDCFCLTPTLKLWPLELPEPTRAMPCTLLYHLDMGIVPAEMLLKMTKEMI